MQSIESSTNQIKITTFNSFAQLPCYEFKTLNTNNKENKEINIEIKATILDMEVNQFPI